MAVGLSEKFSILDRSPLDTAPPPLPEPVTPEARAWRPSRFNIRALTADGSLVIWNTLHGSMSVFAPDQRAEVEELLRRRGFTATEEGLPGYLAERGFVIDAEADEYRRLRLAFGRQHYRSDLLELILLASEDCNFRCTYCYEDFRRGTMKPEVRRAIRKLVARKAPTLRSLSINWFGGEPLYGYEAIEDLAPFFVETARAQEIPLVSSMTTNGYLLTPPVARNLLDWEIRTFRITLDGPAETHDCSRPTRDGEGTFDVILNNLRRMSALEDSFRIDLRVNFDRTNHPRIPELLDTFAEDFGNDRRFNLRFRAVGRWGGPNDADLDVCGDDTGTILYQLRQEALARGLGDSDSLYSVQRLGAQVCYAARPYNFIIGADGDLMKCTIDLDKQDRNLVGKLAPDGRLELDDDKFSLWTEPAFENDSKCQKCVIVPVCQGMHCPQVRFDENRSPCPSLRLGAKKELRGAWSAARGRQRVVEVEAV